MGFLPLRRLSVATAAVIMLTAGGAQAQSQGGPGSTCEAIEAPIEEGGEAFLQVTCGTSGVILGRVDDHELVQIPSLDAAVAVTELAGTRRAWLIMHDNGSGIALEEITGTIARLAGRGASRDIKGLVIDFGDLNTGLLTAAVRAQGQVPVTLDLASLIERSRALRGSAAAGGAN